MELVDSVPWMGALEIRKYRLANGLRVVFVPDHSAPVFACHTWFDVGSRDEKPGTTGIAHLFEHLMFKETKNLAEGEFDKQMEARGASTNAATYFDWTFYHEELGKEHLDFCLGIEADRMANMVLNDHQLETEREVVKNERLMRTENDPEGAMYEALYEQAYDKHSYQWPVIGRKPDLDAIQLQDCLDFYRNFYSPSNAVLVLVGDLTEDEVKAAVTKHYGPLEGRPRPEGAIQEEPFLGKGRRVRLTKPIASDMVLIGYQVPSYMHPDLPALEVANAVLFDGPASRLERRLDAELQLVTRVEGWVPGTKDQGLWETFLGLRQGQDPAAAEREVYEAFDQIGRELVSEDELARARAKLEAGFFRGLRDATDKAYQLGFHEVVAGDAGRLVRNMDRWARVTREDVRRVCARYLVPANRTVVHSVPAAEETEELGAVGPHAAELTGGARLFLEASRDLPLASYRVLTRAGAALDPPGKAGLTRLTIEMLERGSVERDRASYEEAADAMGATMRTYAGYLSTSFGGEVPSRRLPDLRRLVEEAVLRPRFDEEEFEKLRLRAASEVADILNDDGRLAGRALRMEVLEGHPFGHPASGTIETLAGISLDDVKAHHQTLFRRGAVVVAAAGDVDRAELEAGAAELVAGLPDGEAPPLPETPPATPKRRRLVLVDKPDRSQVHYAMGHRGLRAGDEDWVTVKVAETAYGGTFTSRLMQELRVKTGWTYGAYSTDQRGRLEDLHLQVAYPSIEEAPACLAKHLELYQAYVAEGLTEEDLEAAKSYLAARVPFGKDTAAKRLNKLMEPFFLDTPEDYWETYVERVRSVTLGQAREAVQRHRDPDAMVVSVVCTAEGFADRLAEAGLVFDEVRVIPARDLL